MRPRHARSRCRRAHSFTPRYRRGALGRPRPSVPASRLHPSAALMARECRRAWEPAVSKRDKMAASNARSRLKDSQGFIVVAVLWMLAALATLATVYAIYVKETAAAFVGYNDRLEAQALAMAGGELAAFQFTATPPTRPARRRLPFRIGSARGSVRFRSADTPTGLHLAPHER